MRITLVPMIVMFVATCLHLPLCLLFTDVFDLDIRGLSLANSVRDFILFFSVMIYANCSKEVKPAHFMPGAEALRGWCDYMKVALPSAVMICAEWWAFEAFVIIAGTLGVVEQASQIVIQSIIILLFCTPQGIRAATCSIIGNCIGADNIPFAKRFFSMTLKISVVVALGLSLFTLMAR